MAGLANILCALLLLGSFLYAQTPAIHEHPCKVYVPGARCGYIEVLEDRTKPAGRKLNIEFIQVRSTAKHPDPAAWLDIAGGPGIPSTIHAEDELDTFRYVLKYRDLLLYDQRGTGNSSPLRCDLRADVPANEAGDFVPEQGVRRCYQEMSPRADLSKYNTTLGVQDLDELRAALGYDKLVLHALSYGTRVAQAYLQAHPGHVRALILEGAVRPGMRIPLPFARGMQNVLDAVLEDCRHEMPCKPLAAQIDLPKIATMKQIAFTSGGRTIALTPPQFFEMLRTLLYDGEGARRVPLLLAEVSRGDSSQLRKLYEQVHGVHAGFSWPVWLSVTCAEDTPFIREDQIGPASRGTLAGDYRIRQQQKACKLWSVPRRDPSMGKPSDVPMLLMEGELDLVTPPWSAAELRQYFSKGRQVILPKVGHMPIGLEGVECIDTIEEQFVATPISETLDTACSDKIHRQPFLTRAP
jgi:pimeloyl-ACP methyl ester carboxylesterase